MKLLAFKTKSVVSCERCGQELTDPESIARGMGPECAMSAAAQFAAVTSLTEALALGYYDDVARKFMMLRRIAESRLASAKSERNPRLIIKFSKEMKRINGILVQRELQRQSRQERRVA